MSKKYLAEFVGTFALSFIVIAALSAGVSVPLVVPVIAALTLGLFVYTIGSVSGCHINPAVTLGLASVKKISLNEAMMYIVAQVFGAAIAIVVAKFFTLGLPTPAAGIFDIRLFLAEALGTAVFTFGIAAVVKEKVHASMSGMVVGGSLLLGVLFSSLSGASGILNPAVAFALNSVTLVYILAPIVGSVVGFKLSYYLSK
jgi:aquaporin Z